MRFQYRCEVEGCGAKATQLVIDWQTFWIECLCDSHKDDKLAESDQRTATPVVEPPPPE